MEKNIKKDVQDLAQKLRYAGIPVSKNIIDVIVNKRAKKRLGCCRRVRDNEGKQGYVIEISYLVADCSEKAKNTIIVHELIHTCPDCFDHGKKWKEYSRQASLFLGISVKRTADYAQLGIEEPQEKEKVKYILKCPQCGQVYKRKRSCPLIKEPGRYKCGKCGHRLG